MRVLLVTPNLSDRPSARAARLTKALAAAGHEVRLAGPADVFPKRQPPIDIVHIDRLAAMPWARRFHGEYPMALDAVQSVTAWQGRRLDRGRSGIRLVLGRLYQRWLARREMHAAWLCERVFVSFDEDADTLTSLGPPAGCGFAVDIVPAGLDLAEFPQLPPESRNPSAILFAGRMHYAANRAAARQFCAEILPVIRKKHPDARLTLFGDAPAGVRGQFEATLPEGVRWERATEDIRVVASDAAVVVCPLSDDGHGKVLEAMALGKAVVGSREACREVSRASRPECVRIADTPLAYATQLLHLLQTPEEAWRIGGAGRRYVEAWHDWNRLAFRVAAHYEDAIASFRARRA